MIFSAASWPLILLLFPVLCGAALLNIDQGTLSGKVLKSRDGYEFQAFYGIPYAQAPVDQLRFQAPKLPPPSWEGTRDATEKREVCPQSFSPFHKGYVGSEDCLFLHVSTRNTNPEKLMPVLVFFHGGAFNFGSGGLYDADVFMDKPIVFVSINYRLGIFGFFSTGDSSFPGNYGLKDQVAALQWIQKNIRFFGGDPAAVTIMGHSAGAASVHHHLLSPASKDLFHRAIIQSGLATLVWAFSTAEPAKQNFLQFQQHANCSRSSTNESVACLLALPAERLKQLEDTFPSPSTVSKFSPVIESSEHEGAFLVTDPREFVYPKPLKPVIFEFTTNEVVGLGPLYKKFFPPNMTDEKVFNLELPKKLRYEVPDNLELTQNVTNIIKRLYFANDLSNLNAKATSLLLSDMWFKFATVEAVRTYSGVKYVCEYNYIDNLSSREFGAGHSDELRRLFPFDSDRKAEDPHRGVSVNLVAYWSNFILSGNPNIPDEKVPVEWSPVTTDTEENFMYISNDGFRMQKGLMADKIELLPYLQECRKLKPS